MHFLMADIEQDRSLLECVVGLRKSSRSDLISSLSALFTFPLAFWGCEHLAISMSPDIDFGESGRLG
jgi:hypothetical protein